MAQPETSARGPYKGVHDYFTHTYGTVPLSKHEWTAGTASPGIIKQGWDGTIKPGARVLDVGCGIGSESVFLAVRGMHVTAVDISAEAIAVGKKLADAYGVEVDFRVGDVLSLPSADNEFDVFCDQGCFHHMSD